MEIAFASFMNVEEDDNYAMNLVKSIRLFTTPYSDSRILLAFDSEKINDIPIQTILFFERYDVELIPIYIDESFYSIPFMGKSIAAGQVETHVRHTIDYLIWMDIDSLILSFPAEIFAKEKAIQCRPVDIQNIGNTYGEPLQPFWQSVFNLCQVDHRKLFPVITSVDNKEIYPYFNAGMIIVKPARRLLTNWSKNIKRYGLDPSWSIYFKEKPSYAVFLHQALLAGTIMNLCEPDEIGILPYIFNYPLHLHDIYPSGKRIHHLEDLVSFRLDDYDKTGDFSEFNPGERLKSFLDEVLQRLHQSD